MKTRSGSGKAPIASEALAHTASTPDAPNLSRFLKQLGIPGLVFFDRENPIQARYSGGFNGDRSGGRADVPKYLPVPELKRGKGHRPHFHLCNHAGFPFKRLLAKPENPSGSSLLPGLMTGSAGCIRMTFKGENSSPAASEGENERTLSDGVPRSSPIMSLHSEWPDLINSRAIHCGLCSGSVITATFRPLSRGIDHACRCRFRLCGRESSRCQLNPSFRRSWRTGPERW